MSPRLDDHAERRRVSPRRPPVLRQRQLRRGSRTEALRAAPTATRWLLFGAEGVAHVDAAGLDALADLADGLRREDVALVVARVKDPVRRRRDDAGVTERIRAERFYPRVRAAVKACAREDSD
jgi:MFS superfamily sulfate permease-like transporter